MVVSVFAGLFLLAIGVALVLFPYEVAKIDEEGDAFGSKRPPSEVEPADWKVTLTRIFGAIIVIITVLLFALSLLSRFLTG